jgi:hypothetical protein
VAAGRELKGAVKRSCRADGFETVVMSIADRHRRPRRKRAALTITTGWREARRNQIGVSAR